MEAHEINQIEYYEVLQNQISFYCKEKINFGAYGFWEQVIGGGYNFIVYKKYTLPAMFFIKKNNIKKY